MSRDLVLIGEAIPKCSAVNCARAGLYARSARSFANGDCAQAHYVSADASHANNNCGAAHPADGEWHFADTKLDELAGHGTHYLVFSACAWDGGAAVTFTWCEAGSVPLPVRQLRASRHPGTCEDWYAVRGTDGHGRPQALHFTRAERDAWLAGVAAGEFTAGRFLAAAR
jgi:hypothetical protein